MANKNPQVYMDVRTNKLHTQRMIFELFYDTAPFAAENFRALCTGEKGRSPTTQKPLMYQNTYFVKFPKGVSYVEGGAFCYENGTGGESIYGSNFPDEPNEPNEPKMHTHDERGLLSIRKEDRNVCGSHFIITLKRDDSLNSSHVVSGKLVEGYDPLKGFRVPCQIIFCGHYDEDYESSLDGDRTDVESSSDGDKTVDAGRTSFGRPYEPQFIKDEDDHLMEDIEDDILGDKRNVLKKDRQGRLRWIRLLFIIVLVSSFCYVLYYSILPLLGPIAYFDLLIKRWLYNVVAEEGW